MAQGSMTDASVHLTGQLNSASSVLTGRLNNAVIRIDEYEGDYTVIPKIESQELETKDKKMVDNVVIKEIPFYSVSNEFDGNTIIIGGDM